MVSCRTRVRPARTRWGVLLAAVALGAGLLAGCGSSGSNGSGSDLPGSAPVVGGTFPATVEHAFGTTTIPAAPARIVTVGYTDDQAVLAFGGRPVGMTDQYTNPPGQVPDINTRWPWTKDAWGGARPDVVFTNGEAAPNYEKIAALRPDLIIAVYSEIDKAGYDQLSAIAPTVARTATEKEPFSAPWQDNANQIAKALGKPAEGAQAVQRIDARIARARAEHPQYASQTAVAVSWYENQVTPFTSTDVRGRLLSGMGFRSVPEIDRLAGPGEFSVALSPERLNLIDVDRIFVINDAADQQAIKSDPLFANLPAVKAGKVSYLPDSEGSAVGAALSQSTVPSLPYAIDALVGAAG